jgi:predicted Zn finger-like uncharacterized protein
MIDFACPRCGTAQRVTDGAAGQKVACAKCGQRLKVPDPPETRTMNAAALTVPKAPPAKADKQWYYQDGAKQRGPVSWAELKRMAADGDLSPEDLVWGEGMPAWIEARLIPKLFPREEDDGPPEPAPSRRASGTSGKAIAALVLGLVSLFLVVLVPVINLWALTCGLSVVSALLVIGVLVLSLVSFGDIKRSRGRLGGKGLAVAGLLIACVATPLACGVFGYFRVEDSKQRLVVGNNLHMMGLAFHNYAQEHDGKLPEAVPPDTDMLRMLRRSQTRLSWRVALLPYLEQDTLWKQFQQDEPWDSPHNKALLTAMPRVFAHPKHPEENAKGLTYFRVFTGKGTLFPEGYAIYSIGNIPDGTSNTIFVVEAAEPVPWTKPEELAYDPDKPLPKIGGHFRGGTFVLLGDGSSRILGSGISEKTLRNAIDPADGNPLGEDW